MITAKIVQVFLNVKKKGLIIVKFGRTLLDKVNGALCKTYVRLSMGGLRQLFLRLLGVCGGA